jgi:6,7-dimethyl-8-ribityllumazine synthase
MLKYRRPVIVEVLPVFKIEDAEARAADDEFNKGYEAAAAAIEMIAWRRSVGATAASV